MASITTAQYQAMLARTSAARGVAASPPAGGGCSVEADLHGDIAEYCRQHGWLAFHGRMDKPSGRTLGEPDFTILAPGGKVFFVEAKTRTGKRSHEQLAVAAMAAQLGHRVEVVRSMADFLGVVKEK